MRRLAVLGRARGRVRRRARAAREPGELRLLEREHRERRPRTRTAQLPAAALATPPTRRPLTGYADKRNASPLVRAATGADDALAVALGGYKNTNSTRDPARVHRPGAQPAAGRRRRRSPSRATLLPDDASGKQPLTGYSFRPARPAPGSSTVTLAPGRQALAQPLRVDEGQRVPRQQPALHPVVRVTVRYAGYAGDFLSYDVPVTIWDGNGSGP